MQGILYGVGVGPGDPELLTLKGLKIIVESDVIALPTKDKENCTSYSIVKGAYADIDEKEFIYLDYPMSKDKELLQRCRDDNEKKVMNVLEKGKKIAFLTLGDPTIYSTYIYLHKSILEKGYQAKIISGIPSFVAAAAVISDSLCEADEQIHVLPATYGIEELEHMKGTKVLMKAGTKLKEIKEYVKEKDCVVYSVENLYLPNESIITDKNNMKEKGGYFTTVIIKDKVQNNIQDNVTNIEDYEISDETNVVKRRERKNIHPHRILQTFLICMLTCMLLLVGCKGKEKPNNQHETDKNSITFIDSLGREVTVTNPKKVAAFMGSYAEVWLLSGGTLAAVTDDAYDERNLELSDEVITLGKMNAVNMELVLEEGIDFVLLSSETTEHVEVKDTLDKLGIPSAYFKVETFQDYLAMLDVCTDITGRKDLYKTNGEDIKAGIDEIIKEVPKEKTPSVLFLRAFSTGVKAKGSDSMTGIMLKELGCVNIADTDNSLLEDLNMEKIVEDDPDYIFVVTMGSSSEKALEAVNELLLSNPAWKGLAAVKNEKYHVLPKQLFHSKPNARWKESYEMLAGILYEGK